MILQEKRVRVKFLFCIWICLAVAGIALWSYRHPMLPIDLAFLAPAAAEPLEVKRPPTHLPLRLIGVLLSEETGAQHSPIAVIQDLQRWRMALYEAGDLISNEMVVTGVTKSEATVSFLRSGDTFTLSLDDRSDPIGRGLIVSYVSANERLIDRQAMQREGVPVFLALIQKAIASPMRWRGLPGGIDTGGSSEGILRALGLESGDRIVSVNGKPLEGYRHALRVLVEAVAGSSVSISLIRGGTQQKKMTYRLTP